MNFPRNRSKIRGNCPAELFVPNTNAGQKKKTDPEFDTPGQIYDDFMVKKPQKWQKNPPKTAKKHQKKWISREIEAKLEEIDPPFFFVPNINLGAN